jgi:hypothetical protein
MGDRPVLLACQRLCINRVPDLTPRFDNVICNINNETSTDPAWGRCRIAHARARADAAGAEIYLTDMFEAHALSRDPFQQQVVADPGVYDSVSAGQVTSLRNSAAEQRSQIAWLRQELAEAPRPMSSSSPAAARSNCGWIALGPGPSTSPRTTSRLAPGVRPRESKRSAGWS